MIALKVLKVKFLTMSAFHKSDSAAAFSQNFSFFIAIMEKNLAEALQSIFRYISLLGILQQ